VKPVYSLKDEELELGCETVYFINNLKKTNQQLNKYDESTSQEP